jgi:hypothetical protein
VWYERQVGEGAVRGRTLFGLTLLGLALVSCPGTRSPRNQVDQGPLQDSAAEGSTGDVGAGPTLCQRTCSTTDNCCDAGTCGSGQSAQTCSGGLCRYVGCSSNADCSNLKGTQCEKVSYLGNTLGFCVTVCTADSECTSPQKCVTATVESKSVKLCATACATDSECSSGLQCVRKTWCNYRNGLTGPCLSDQDCGTESGNTKCDLASGVCVCTNSSTCPSSGGVSGTCAAYRY